MTSPCSIRSRACRPAPTSWTRLKSCLLNAARNGLSCALLYLDLDDFKPINDRDGHEVGDEVLKVVGQRMRGALRESDTVCRWGGDEFLILLPQPGTVSELLELVERLLAQLAEPILVRGDSYRISASVGIARFPDDGRTAEESASCGGHGHVRGQAPREGAHRSGRRPGFRT